MMTALRAEELQSPTTTNENVTNPSNNNAANSTNETNDAEGEKSASDYSDSDSSIESDHDTSEMEKMTKVGIKDTKLGAKYNRCMEKGDPYILKNKDQFNTWWKDANYHLDDIGFDNVLEKLMEKHAAQDRRSMRLVEEHIVSSYLHRTIRLPNYNPCGDNAQELLSDLFSMLGFIQPYFKCAALETKAHIDLTKEKNIVITEWKNTELTWKVSGYKADPIKILNNMAYNMVKDTHTQPLYRILTHYIAQATKRKQVNIKRVIDKIFAKYVEISQHMDLSYLNHTSTNIQRPSNTHHSTVEEVDTDDARGINAIKRRYDTSQMNSGGNPINKRRQYDSRYNNSQQYNAQQACSICQRTNHLWRACRYKKRSGCPKCGAQHQIYECPQIKRHQINSIYQDHVTSTNYNNTYAHEDDEQHRILNEASQRRY